MKPIIILCLFLISCIKSHFVNAQSTILVSAGPSIPQGDLANKDDHYYSIGKPLLVNTGLGLDVGYVYSFKNKFGLAASLRYQQWSSGIYPDPYKSISVLIGGIYSIKIAKKLFVEPKIMGGLSNVYTPVTEIPHGPDPSLQSTSPQWAVAAIFCAGSILRYNLTKGIDLLLMTDYSLSTPTFKYKQVNPTYIVSPSINSLNFKIGVGFKI